MMANDELAPHYQDSHRSLQDWRFDCRWHTVTLSYGLVTVASDIFGPILARGSPPTYTRAGTAVILPPAADR